MRRHPPASGTWEIAEVAFDTPSVIPSFTASAPTLPAVQRLAVDAANTLRLKVGGTTVLTYQNTSSPLRQSG